MKFFASLLLVTLIFLTGCQKDKTEIDERLVTQTRLNQLQHFMMLLNAEGALVPDLDRETLHQLIYSKFSRDINEWRITSPYYEEGMGFLDGWGRKMKLRIEPGYRHYSYGEDAVDDFGEGDDMNAHLSVKVSG